METNLIEKVREQRDLLASALVAIVKEDADGKGMFAKMAMQALEDLAWSMAQER